MAARSFQNLERFLMHKVKKIAYFLGLFVYSGVIHTQTKINNPNSFIWSRLYHKILTMDDRQTYQNKSILLFTKENIFPFSQLLFSWNAIRPETGYFSFYVQARHGKTKQWDDWHHMIDWGADVQRSYSSKLGNFSHYIHVRLEVTNQILADAFRIKVVAHEGAHLGLLHALAVAVANFHIFKPERATWNGLKSTIINSVPKISQFELAHPDKERICSPTSCSMVLEYLTGNWVNPLNFANRVFDDGLQAYGSWPFNIAHAYELLQNKLWIFTVRLNSFKELHQQLIRGIPVIVSVRGHLPRAPKDYPYGHLLVVVGWNAKQQEVICHDPAFPSTAKTLIQYNINDFLRAWERSNRLAYWAEPMRNNK